MLAFIVLVISFLIEGNAWRVAMREYQHRTKDIETTVFQYISEAKDPTLVAMILEDSIAMIGIFVSNHGYYAFLSHWKSCVGYFVLFLDRNITGYCSSFFGSGKYDLFV